jgi:hypothetical protein
MILGVGTTTSTAPGAGNGLLGAFICLFRKPL